MYYTPGLNNYRLKHEEDLSGEKFDEGGACSENMRSDRYSGVYVILHDLGASHLSLSQGLQPCS
jgi:hypothetical protein